MVMHDYDSNAILAEAILDRKSSTFQKAFKNLYKQIFLKGHVPTIYRLENEILEDYTRILQELELPYKLVPPYIHRHNLSKRAMHTCKNHFIEGFSSADPAFPLTM